MDFKTQINKDWLKNHGLDANGVAQQYIDATTLRECNKYVPKDTGALIESSNKATKLGKGQVVWDTKYARSQYYGHNFRHEGIRSGHWGEIAKSNGLITTIKKGLVEILNPEK